ncbi:DUF2259 domain-containing protein [Rhizobium sp. RU20A]|uniref:DUF2259 domain-containing protein n=1 Tax=Rhizobium sp. RU20A TaxID=1907412 RepID=UPI001FCE8EA3|nr:DUF2259 domain-containing protein [Rhizobium sp. RU20A]
MSQFSPIGFSEDGRIFAFEEFGVQDGSGFAYSSIFVIDLVRDAFLDGSPVRAVLDDERAPLARARRDARRLAAPLIDAYRLPDRPGFLVAFNPETQVDLPADTLAYRALPGAPDFVKPYRLKLETTDVPATGICKDFVPTLKAFRLMLTEADGEPSNRVLHDDAGNVPTSRRCVTDYRIGGAITYMPLDMNEMHVVLIQVLSRGFEGSTDGRWIVVPLPVGPKK